CSQGEKQKILIARALMANPDLLILDEPTNGLDFVAKEDLLQTIEHLATRPDAPTIIFVSHHIDEVLPTFTDVLLLKDGTTFATGTRADVLTDANMSALYGRNISIDWKAARAWWMLEQLDCASPRPPLAGIHPNSSLWSCALSPVFLHS